MAPTANAPDRAPADHLAHRVRKHRSKGFDEVAQVRSPRAAPTTLLLDGATRSKQPPAIRKPCSPSMARIGRTFSPLSPRSCRVSTRSTERELRHPLAPESTPGVSGGRAQSPLQPMERLHTSDPRDALDGYVADGIPKPLGSGGLIKLAGRASVYDDMKPLAACHD